MERAESFYHIDELIDHVRSVHSFPYLVRRWYDPAEPCTVFVHRFEDNIIHEASEKFFSKLNNMFIRKERFKFRKICNRFDFNFFKTSKTEISFSESSLFDFYILFHSENFLSDSLGLMNFLGAFLEILGSGDNFFQNLEAKLLKMGFEKNLILKFLNLSICLFPELRNMK